METDWTLAATRWIEARLEEAIAQRGRASLALCGGSTPQGVYSSLAAGLAGDRVELYFGDERCVPPDHPDSTFRLVTEFLLDHVRGVAPVVHRMEGEAQDLDAAARRYEALLPERFDVVIAGMGEDGHTASLFPGHPATRERERRVLHVADAPKPPPDRLTLTVPVLEAARHTVMLVRGASKADAVARALGGTLDLSGCPAQVCRAGAWFLDPAAAAALDSEMTA